MNRFLIIRFEFFKDFYYSLILCKVKENITEYRVTVMNGDIEKLLCNNNIIRETNDCLEVETCGNTFLQQLKLEIAKALGKTVRKPVKEVERVGAIE